MGTSICSMILRVEMAIFLESVIGIPVMDDNYLKYSITTAHFRVNMACSWLDLLLLWIDFSGYQWLGSLIPFEMIGG